MQRGERGRGGLDGAAELKEVGEEAAGRAGVDGPAQYVAVEEVPVVARAYEGPPLLPGVQQAFGGSTLIASRSTV
ncbi:hypothetical protein [Streptomyces sp. NPDC059349]|uniref:hypothetical protein n=1 Tax=Streptomyces sp. NPDC059349 TaxID=3346808 RepID=UPI0036B9530C